MFARLKQILIKEFIQVFRDKRTRFILFGPPIVQMLIFGYAATFEIRHVSTVVLDLDQSQESRELVSRFTSSPYFNVEASRLKRAANSRLSSTAATPPSASRSMLVSRKSCARARQPPFR